MTDIVAVEPITASDDEIRTALLAAELPSLLAAVAYATGDLTVLRPDLRVDPLLAREEKAGFTTEQQSAIREVAFDALTRFRDAGSVPHPPAGHESLQQIIEFVAGTVVSADYLPLLEEELAITDGDPRAPKWNKAQVAADLRTLYTIEYQSTNDKRDGKWRALEPARRPSSPRSLSRS